MAKIRADLVGVTVVALPDSRTIVLAAGDDIPEGITVGNHLIEDIAGEPTTEPVDTSETTGDPETGDGESGQEPTTEPVEPVPGPRRRRSRTTK